MHLSIRLETQARLAEVVSSPSQLGLERGGDFQFTHVKRESVEKLPA
jgi:hypothetical protein